MRPGSGLRNQRLIASIQFIASHNVSRRFVNILINQSLRWLFSLSRPTLVEKQATTRLRKRPHQLSGPMMHQLLSATRIKASTQIARKTNRELWLSDDHGAYGNGRLVLRVSVSGVQRFYYRPPRGQGHSSKAIPLGLYSRTQRNGYLTLSQARNRAFNLASNVAFPKDQSSV